MSVGFQNPRVHFHDWKQWVKLPGSGSFFFSGCSRSCSCGIFVLPDFQVVVGEVPGLLYEWDIQADSRDSWDSTSIPGSLTPCAWFLVRAVFWRDNQYCNPPGFYYRFRFTCCSFFFHLFQKLIGAATSFLNNNFYRTDHFRIF